jgi:hypothetical protein
VFSWKTQPNLDPYLRAAYAMQCISVLAILGGLFLVWWQGPAIENLTAFNLFNRSLDDLRERDPKFIAQPLNVLWLLWPAILISAIRGVTGILVTPVWFRRLALVAWVAALLALGHFYINYGDELAKVSPVKDWEIGIGFWLTASSTVILGLLILTEGIIKAPDLTWMPPQPTAKGPVNDAERLWRGEYLTCPHCGMLNELGSKTCFNCHNLLFDFRGDQ